jgi:transcriptional regulator with XRE-family HTH domain
MDHVRQLIEAKVKELDLDLSSLSQSMGRNHAYLQQFLRRGVPAELKERDRAALAPLIGVNPDDLRLEWVTVSRPPIGSGQSSILKLHGSLVPQRVSPIELAFYEDLAWRLKLAIEALDKTINEVAEAIGTSTPELNQWIAARAKPDWFCISQFCKRYGVSADWLLLGDLSGLKKRLADSLAPAVEERTAAQLEATRRSPEKTS